MESTARTLGYLYLNRVVWYKFVTEQEPRHDI